ncbi:POU domain class 2-associating factor 1 [Myripristis murdjan]|uniref:POU domain class 2-associating factor 1 n=1 Tax=Myripristis murdjan TaxID=586833 RepID=UPI0011762AC2|nr:POU domain class 2-associating factor 1 [Myripristis murdjan]
MQWEKSPPPVLGRSRPYQGVRVRDPVKELLRRKRGLESHSTKSAPPAVDVVPHNNQSSSQSPFAQGNFGFEATSGSSGVPLATVSDGGLQCAGWKAPPTATTASFQPAVPPWSSSDYNQPDPSAQTLAYPATPALTADVYMQTLCPSYTMLTYTHTPLLTNIGTIPVASSPASLPQMDLQDSGLTYLPWAQPLTTISTMPTSGVQFSPGSAPLPGSPLVHMPLSMSLTTMIPQLEAQGLEPQPQILELPQPADHQLNPEPRAQTLDEDQEVEPEPPNPLEKLLEDPKEEHEEEGKDTYSSSLFIPTV